MYVLIFIKSTFINSLHTSTLSCSSSNILCIRFYTYEYFTNLLFTLINVIRDKTVIRLTIVLAVWATSVDKAALRAERITSESSTVFSRESFRSHQYFSMFIHQCLSDHRYFITKFGKTLLRWQNNVNTCIHRGRRYNYAAIMYCT